jgi:hypothetical protein
MTAENKKTEVRPQRFAQESSKKFQTFASAKKHYDEIDPVVRKRIRRRADNTFDLVIYKPIEVDDVESANR